MKTYTGTFVLDLDGVLHDFYGAFKEWCLKGNFVTQEVIDQTDDSKYKFYEEWGWTDNEFLKAQAIFAEARGFENGEPTKGTRDFLAQLRELGLKVIVATKRPKEAEEDTYRWCWRHLYVAKSDVWMVGHKPDALMDVARHPRYPKPWFAIEDYPKNIEALHNWGVMCFLWDQPWNRQGTLGNYFRTQSFDDVVHSVKNRLNIGRQLPNLSDMGNVIEQATDAIIEREKNAGRWSGVGDIMRGPAPTREVTVTNEQTGGKKGIKPERMDLVPVGPLTELARLYGEGAKKYEDRNWEKGYDWNLSYGAMLRHITQFWNGEDRDAETGCHHLASVAFHAFALMQFGVTHPELDNRPGSVDVRKDVA